MTLPGKMHTVNFGSISWEQMEALKYENNITKSLKIKLAKPQPQKQVRTDMLNLDRVFVC